MGASSPEVIGTEAGPSLVLAQLVSPENQDVGGDDDCPAGTGSIIRTIWSGGVDGDMGDELNEDQLDAFIVEVESDGEDGFINPFAFGDLNDGDNNGDLCLEEDDTGARRVRVLANTVTDPTNDWNEETVAEVTPD